MVFYIAAGVIFFASVGVVTARNVVHAALFLLLALAGIAGVFVLLYAEFLALVQLLIYGGAVTIVILFALMLTKTEEFELQSDNKRQPFAILAASMLFALMAFAFVIDAEKFQTSSAEVIDLDTLASTLFVDWVIPFEIASVVLLIALVGAVLIGRTEKQEDESFPEFEPPITFLSLGNRSPKTNTDLIRPVNSSKVKRRRRRGAD